jgi:phage terminase Nu1 subunit (DNA packaging protein)
VTAFMMLLLCYRNLPANTAGSISVELQIQNSEYQSQVMFALIDEQKLDRIFDEIDSLRQELKTEKAKTSKKLSETWLDNQEVMELLKISPRTLQNLRDSKSLPFSKVGGKIYYKASDVEKILSENYHG